MSHKAISMFMTLALVVTVAFAFGFRLAKDLAKYTPEESVAVMNDYAARLDSLEDRLNGAHANEPISAVVIKERIEALENNMNSNPKTFGARMYHVDSKGDLYDLSRHGKELKVGPLTEDQLTRYRACQSRRDFDGMRSIIAEVTAEKFGVYNNPILKGR